MTGQDVQINWSKLITSIPGAAADKKRLALAERRLKRLRAIKRSAERATALLRDYCNDGPIKPDGIRIRHDFVFQDKPLVGSDRKLPPPKSRPPASRLISPRGASLRLELIALFEAQIRTPPGSRPDNKRPIAGEVGRFGISWIDLLASTAMSSGAGRTTHIDREKRARQVRETLKKLANEDHELVSLPRGHLSTGTYENFLLNHEGGVGPHGTQPARYTVPDSDFFTIPIELFTYGWIHVLEDTEIVFLMMVLREQPNDPTLQFRVTAAERVQHYGIGPHTYDAHRLLSEVGLVEVVEDTSRHPDGRVVDYDGHNALPHLLRFTAEGLTHPGATTVVKFFEDYTTTE